MFEIQAVFKKEKKTKEQNYNAMHISVVNHIQVGIDL